MVAGGLAAPSLALAAFFFTNSGGSHTPARPAAAQAGTSTTATAPGRPSPSGAPAPATTSTTSTTTAPAAPGAPRRDPFTPLVTSAPAGGTPAR